MKKIINQENLIRIFMIFIILQPILDIYILFEWDVVNLFGFSPATIIRMVFMAILSIWAILTIKIKKKHIWILVYGVLVGIYVILHHMHAADFNSMVPDDFNYSFKDELFYIIRLLMPLIMIIISYCQKFTFKQLKIVINSLILLISGSIVVTNIFKIALGSYTKATIEASIFSWFMPGNEYNYLELASKGFFTDATRMSALMLLLTPLLLYICIKECNKKQIAVLFIHMFGMLIIGTKVAAFGFIGLLGITLMVYLYQTLMKKEFDIKGQVMTALLVVTMVSSILFAFSPTINRMNLDEKKHNTYEKTGVFKESETSVYSKDKAEAAKSKTEIQDIKEKTKEDILTYIENNYKKFNINENFILISYSYKYDPEFWLEVMESPIEERTNYRILEEKIWKRIKEVNNNNMDNLFGMTFSRLKKTFDLERDFISHSYSLGIIGMIILLFPYIIIYLVCGIYILYKYKEKFTLYNVMLMLALGITLFAGFYSGNVMDGLIATLILGFTFGQLIRSVFNTENKVE